jgi:hypothetical protein
MGSGASRQALLQHSDSRIGALLAEARKNPDDERLFELALEKIPPGMRVELSNRERPATERATPYLEGRWCHDATASLHEAELPASDNVANDESDEKSGREDRYSTDDFEEDGVNEWKKGASIGAGSYGTVRSWLDRYATTVLLINTVLARCTWLATKTLAV